MTSRRSCSAWWALSRITFGRAGDLPGGGVGTVLQRAGVHAQQRQPVAEHVMHLPGDLLAGVVLGLLGAQAAPRSRRGPRGHAATARAGAGGG